MVAYGSMLAVLRVSQMCDIHPFSEPLHHKDTPAQLATLAWPKAGAGLVAMWRSLAPLGCSFQIVLLATTIIQPPNGNKACACGVIEGKILSQT